MHRMPPTTEPVSRNSLDEKFVWILADEKGEGTTGAEDARHPRDVLSWELGKSASRSGELPSASVAR
jgi:hypothetical protein